MYEQCFGEIPSGLIVRHKCDNPGCINPGHLELGTNKQNMADRRRHGTWLSGEKHPLHILTADQVREIRRRVVTGRGWKFRGNRKQLAEEYGVSRDAIADIAARRSWLEI